MHKKNTRKKKVVMTYLNHQQCSSGSFLCCSKLRILYLFLYSIFSFSFHSNLRPAHAVLIQVNFPFSLKLVEVFLEQWLNYLALRAIVSSITKLLFISSQFVCIPDFLLELKKGTLRDSKPKPTEQETHLLLKGFEHYQRAVLSKK